MSTCRCPTCETRFDPATSRTMPFCSDRCRLIDLGRWLSEKHSVPAPPSLDEELDDAREDRSEDDES